MTEKLMLGWLCLFWAIVSPAQVIRTTKADSLRLAADERQFIIEDSVLIKTKDGATLSAVVVRKRGLTTPQPTALLYFIYSNTDRSLAEAKYAAARGYVGVVADTRASA